VIGVDTNVLARYFVEEREAARRLIESGQPLFDPKSVLLELEWVLRGYDRFAAGQVVQALAGLHEGLNFADALHHASCRHCHAFASFDTRSLAGPARGMNLQPWVITPQ